MSDIVKIFVLHVTSNFQREFSALVLVSRKYVYQTTTNFEPHSNAIQISLNFFY